MLYSLRHRCGEYTFLKVDKPYSNLQKCITKSMIVLFHENVLLLSTYKFIVIPIKYRNFGVFVYDSVKKQMLNTISLVIERQKNDFDTIPKV